MEGKESKTKPPGIISNSYNPNVPQVHSLNSHSLEKKGWVRNGMVWGKDGKVITYDGAQWKYEGMVVQFFEDLK